MRLPLALWHFGIDLIQSKYNASVANFVNDHQFANCEHILNTFLMSIKSQGFLLFHNK